MGGVNCGALPEVVIHCLDRPTNEVVLKPSCTAIVRSPLAGNTTRQLVPRETSWKLSEKPTGNESTGKVVTELKLSPVAPRGFTTRTEKSCLLKKHRSDLNNRYIWVYDCLAKRKRWVSKMTPNSPKLPLATDASSVFETAVR